ncbi:PREDICTED: WW domain-containing adapter protein with coiled-coil-like isoform X2 [Priapulus caudatus]|uniref:WW domain-containing adapter protein with coiled-coil-like isoform X2 n=1 Tax=Priapulus caudatus TaxID=37621 RepID=A0ABM1F9L6_PRICU|nr:PREDICTED: WW domain-containing adapter protein with coiled-coil-like isoform X2 [Priapulus caudatus]
MVMHARKIPRLSDGYHESLETHQIKSLGKYASPTNNGTPARKADSPISKEDSRSPHSYHHKSSYAQRQREKEREREKEKDREQLKSRGNDNSGKLDSKTSSSHHLTPKAVNDNRNTNHDRTKLETFGDWSEQISSSGKKYYYNCKTEVSQWEKPKDWINRWITTGENPFGPTTSSNTPLELPDPKMKELSRGYSHTDRHEKHSSDRRPAEHSRQHRNNSLSQNSDSGHRMSHAHAQAQEVERSRQRCSSGNQDPRSLSMSPGSTPTEMRDTLAGAAHAAVAAQIISQLATSAGKHEITAQEALQTIQQALLFSQQTSGAHTSVMSSHPLPSQSVSHISPRPAGAPPPVHMIPLPTGDPGEDDAYRSPSEASRGTSGRDTPSPSPALPGASSLQNIASLGTTSSLAAAIRPSTASLSPSLANYYNSALMGHLTGWQADYAERQANRFSEEANGYGNLQCTQVSAELKSARSMVRVQEIMSTLQEQRVLFLREQIADNEESKNKNSFM